MRIEAGPSIMAANPNAGRALVPVARVGDPGGDRRSEDRGRSSRPPASPEPDPRLPPGRLFAPIVAQILSGRDAAAGAGPYRRAGTEAAIRAYGEALRRTERLQAGTMLARSA